MVVGKKKRKIKEREEDGAQRQRKGCHSIETTDDAFVKNHSTTLDKITLHEKDTCDKKKMR